MSKPLSKLALHQEYARTWGQSAAARMAPVAERLQVHSQSAESTATLASHEADAAISCLHNDVMGWKTQWPRQGSISVANGA